MPDRDGDEEPDPSSETVPCTLWQDPTFQPICCCPVHVTSAIHPFFTQRGWGHTTSSGLSVLHPNDPHLSFNELSPSLMQAKQQWNYQVRPFYSIIFHCNTVDPDIVTVIITSNCFNPLQIHIEIWRVYELAGLDWDQDDNFHTILKPVSLITTLATSDHRNHLSKIFTKEKDQ